MPPKLPRKDRLARDAEILHTAWAREDAAMACISREVPPGMDRSGRAAYIRDAVRESRDPGAVRLIREADAHVWRLADLYRSYGGKIAKRFRVFGESEDVDQWALLGLYQAAVRFDPEMGFSFTTYAKRSILTSVYRGQHLDQPVTVSVVNAQLAWRLGKLERERPDADDATLAELLGVPPRRIGTLRAAQRARVPPVRLDAPASPDTDMPLVETLVSPEPSPEDHLVVTDAQRQVGPALQRIATLPDREQLVLRRSLGLDGKAATFREIGAYMGLSHERARQIQKSAIRQIREGLVKEKPVGRKREHPPLLTEDGSPNLDPAPGKHCRIRGCGKPAVSFGLCNSAYGLWDRAGRPASIAAARPVKVKGMDIADEILCLRSLRAWLLSRTPVQPLPPEQEERLLAGMHPEDRAAVIAWTRQAAQLEERARTAEEALARLQEDARLREEEVHLDEADLRRRVALLDEAARLREQALRRVG